ncbi:hypothetical protein NDU88_000083 [Pleurodeles waltl]|uniref:Uncharacterized protein n=1 Tax=Pleurodeles waltl TaxID=8319 RepID=A0AAV7UQ97_PLEWA|nr:hypothetical protein NDU88_000083 [Pleurodeles waltl]
MQETHGSNNSRLTGEALPNLRPSKTALKKPRITPSLKTYFKVLPQEREMEEEDHGNFDLTPERRIVGTQVPQIESSPNRFQPLEEENQGRSNNSGITSQDDAMNFSKRISTRQGQDLEKVERQGGGGDLKQEENATPSVLAAPEEPLTQCIAGMICDLAVEVRGSFEKSNFNQKEIRGLCEALGQKFDDLADRTVTLEIEVSELKRATENNAEAIQQMKVEEDKVLLKHKLMENNMRKNDLRFLKFLKVWKAGSEEFGGLSN